MSESDNETDLDPRIQIELEKLNLTTDEINKLEIEYDVCKFYNSTVNNLLILITGSKHIISNPFK